MKTYISLVFVILSINSFGQFNYNKQKISDRTAKVVSKIAKVNKLMGSAVGFAGTRPAQYNNFAELQKIAKQSELLELTNHPNTVVRSYAFWALSLKPGVKLLPILEKHINDTANVSTMFGCIVGDEKVGDFLISKAIEQRDGKNSKNFSKEDARYLDDLLISSSTTLRAKQDAIDRSKK
ncbi:hypothetical protein HHL16_09990 [Pseudoflavitalea sp. G-6-1-2]|uniref:hypothetical protein n=1 Tax=Pseudoflavitalea sp. G-6-1-2 TaxID=2728841 RepID=UPI00146E4EDE|nr:hypothetical protein [Pseudoflavitalea sp. G-6-1-2]NML21203.1 hypothetical protein [Pseudoflavitalea sp. G-6-1-2]